jgi:signal transduction histidine kinase
LRFLPIDVEPEQTGMPDSTSKLARYGSGMGSGMGSNVDLSVSTGAHLACSVMQGSSIQLPSLIEFGSAKFGEANEAGASSTKVQQILLPTPGIHLLELVSEVKLGNGGLKALLRLNPALFLFGVANYYGANGKSPRSFKRLIGWLEGGMLEGGMSDAIGRDLIGDNNCSSNSVASWALNSCDGVNGSTKQHQELLTGLRPALKQFVCSGSNQELRRSLVGFLVAATGIKKKSAKKWIGELVGKDLKFKRVSSKKQKARLRKSDADWKITLPSSVNVEQMFRYRRSHEMTEAEFGDRLLMEKLDAMKQLAYGASHEINNPLANIATRAQTLMAGEANPERQHKLAVIYEQAMRAHEMISDMMLFGNPPKLMLASTDLRLLVARIVKEITPELNSNAAKLSSAADLPISLEVRIGPDVKNLIVDATQVSVALKAILRNSIDAIESSELVGRAAGLILLRIEVSEAVENHLFDPFYSGREAGRGLGFGLSKAWRIAQLHSGDLKFDKKHQPGARFVLTIPSSRLRIARIDNSSAA